MSDPFAGIGGAAPAQAAETSPTMSSSTSTGGDPFAGIGSGPAVDSAPPAPDATPAPLQAGTTGEPEPEPITPETIDSGDGGGKLPALFKPPENKAMSNLKQSNLQAALGGLKQPLGKTFQDAFNQAMTKPLPEPPQLSENKGFENPVKNTIKDLQSMVQSGISVANAGLQRTVAAFPPEAKMVGIPGQGSPIFGQVGAGIQKELQQNPPTSPQDAIYRTALGANEDPDLKVLTGMLGGGVQQAADRYVSPFTNYPLPDALGMIGRDAYNHPVNAALNLAPGMKAFKFAGPALKAGAVKFSGAAPRVAYGLAGKEGLRSFRNIEGHASHAGQAVSTVKSLATQPFMDMLNAAKYEKGVTKLLDEALRKAHLEYLDWLKTINRELNELYKDIPSELKAVLTSGIEQVDDVAMQRIEHSQVAQKFVAKLAEFQNGWTDRAIAIGNKIRESLAKGVKDGAITAQQAAEIGKGILTQEQVDFDRYAGPFLAQLKKAGISMNFDQLAKDAGAMEDFTDYMNMMKANGQHPLWQPIREARAVDKFLEQAAAPLNISKEDFSFTIKRVETLIHETPEGGYSLRLPGGPFEANSLKLSKDGILRTIRVTLMQEAIDEFINQAYMDRVGQKMVLGKVSDILQGLNTHPTLRAAIEKEVGKFIALPAEMWDNLKVLMDTGKKTSGLIWDFCKSLMRVKSRFILALNPLRGPVQWLQNAALFGMAEINSARDLLTGYIAMVAAMNPKFRNLVPGRFYTGQRAIKNTEYYTDHLPKLLLALNKFDRFVIEGHLQAVEGMDNYWRGAMAIKGALDDFMDLPGGAQGLLDRSFKLSNTALKEIKSYLKDPAKSEKYFKGVITILGDYTSALGPLEQGIADNIMFYRWMRHAFFMAKSLPGDHPFKVQALNAIGTTTEKILQTGNMTERMRKAGVTAVRDKDGNQVKDPNGMPMVQIHGGSLTPFIQAPADAARVMGVLSQQDDLDMGGMPFGPFWGLTDGLLLGRKLDAGNTPFKDPDSIKVRDSFIKRSDVKESETTGKEIPQSAFVPSRRPNGLEFTLRTIFPTIVDPMSKIYEANQEQPGVPSDFTIPGVHSAPRRNMDGTRVKPPDVNLLGQVLFGKAQGYAPAIDQETEQSILNSDRRKALKLYSMSGGDRP